jgi:hypothetical protein
MFEITYICGNAKITRVSQGIAKSITISHTGRSPINGRTI